MPTPRSFLKAAEKRSADRYFQEQLLRRTKAFRKFLQDNQEQIRQEIEFLQEADKSLPTALHDDYSFDYQALLAFYKTEEGEKLAQDFRLLPLEKSACRVIPHQKSRIISSDIPSWADSPYCLGRLDISPHLRERRFLTVEIDLSRPRALIDQAINLLLKRYSPHADQPEIKIRGRGKHSKEEIDQIFRAFDLVEEYLAQGENYHQSLIKATIDLLSKKRKIHLNENPAEDKRYQKVKRWHERVKQTIGDK